MKIRFEAPRFYFVFGVMIAGGLLGLGSTLLAIKLVSDVETITVGPWQTFPAGAENDSNAWLRAARSLSGTWPLQNGPAQINYTAFTDSAGDRLDGACTYVVSGRVPQAEDWTLAIYGKDHRPLDAARTGWAIRSGDVVADGQSRIAVDVGGDHPDQRLSLTLRLYGPAEQLQQAPGSANLFSIEKLGCA